MKVFGLTGGIATGKSSVGRILASQGVAVIDADQVARDVVRVGSPTLKALVDSFGEQILDAEGQLDRQAMRARIATDPGARSTLEGITHPAIRLAIAEQLTKLAAAGATEAVVEAALMVETGSYRLYHALIVVTCSPEEQLKRVLTRDGGTEEQAAALIRTQLPLADKEAVADYVIVNDGTLATLHERTLAVWEAARASHSSI